MGRTLGRTAAFRALWRALSASKGGPGLLTRLGAVPRMMWATLSGRYDGGGRLLLMTLAIAYVLSPVDLLPELILWIPGLFDDFFVITWIAGAFIGETDRFLAWEAGAAGGGPGTPPRQGGRPAPEVVDGEVV